MSYSFPGVSYTRTRSSASLPVHLTSVGCYGSEEKLIDCGYHKYYTTSNPSIDPFYFDYYLPVNYIETNPSMDISISCFSSVDSNASKMKNNISRDSTNSAESSAEVNNVSTASLIIAVIALVAVMGLVAIRVLCNLLIVFKKR